MNSETPAKWTAARIRALKGRQRIVALTAGDYATARRMDEAGVDIVLVGDSLGMTLLGYPTTLPVTMADMLHHTAAVVRGVRRALVVADMPFMSYQVSAGRALENAGRFLQEAGADAVKIEGGAFRAPTVAALVGNGIPVMGHIGLTPQSVKELGGYRVQGRSEEGRRQLLEDARAVAEAGAFAIVLEAMPSDLAAELTAAVAVPTVGIGAGPRCDGQVLVEHDLLGLTAGKIPKFARAYAQLGEAASRAIETYAREVREGVFPGPDQCYD